MTPHVDRDQNASPQRRSVLHAFTGFVLVGCIVVLFVRGLAAASACGGWGGGDTTTCAYSRAKNGTYQGRLLTASGARLRNYAFSVSFPSRRSSRPASVHGFSTDAQGGYCILWAQEHGQPYVDSIGKALALWQPLNGGRAPPGCQSGEEGIPWNQAEDLQGSPQYFAVFWILVPAIVLLLAALIIGTVPAARWPRAIGFALAAVGTALAIAFWPL